MRERSLSKSGRMMRKKWTPDVHNDGDDDDDAVVSGGGGRGGGEEDAARQEPECISFHVGKHGKFG